VRSEVTWNRDSITSAIVRRIRNENWNHNIISYAINPRKKNFTPIFIFANNHFRRTISQFKLSEVITLSIINLKIWNFCNFVVEYAKVNTEFSSPDSEQVNNSRKNEFSWTVAIFILYLLFIYSVYIAIWHNIAIAFTSIWNLLLWNITKRVLIMFIHTWILYGNRTFRKKRLMFNTYLSYRDIRILKLDSAQTRFLLTVLIVILTQF